MNAFRRPYGLRHHKSSPAHESLVPNGSLVSLVPICVAFVTRVTIVTRVTRVARVSVQNPEPCNGPFVDAQGNVVSTTPSLGLPS